MSTSPPPGVVEHHPLAIRWFHWLNFPILFTMIWSGLLIYWANDVMAIRVGSHVLFHFFPPGFYTRLGLEQRLAEGMAWHFLFAWLFTVNGVLYVLYTAISGAWRELLPDRNSLRDAFLVVLHDLRLRRDKPPQRTYNAAQRIAYSAIIVMGAGSALTGLAVYKPIQAGWLAAAFGGYRAARFLHFWLTMGYCAFFLVHIAQVVRAGWANFRSMLTGYDIEHAPETTP